MKDFRKLKINRVHKFKEADVKKISFWENKCKDIKQGVYIYWLANKKIPYPFKKSQIFYIGKAKNVVNRLRHHFTVGYREKLVNNEKARSWVYLNYYITKVPFNITIFSVNPSLSLAELEKLFIGIFLLEYGTMPLCNGMIYRNAFKRVYDSYSKSDKRQIRKLLINL